MPSAYSLNFVSIATVPYYSTLTQIIVITVWVCNRVKIKISDRVAMKHEVSLYMKLMNVQCL